MNALAELNIAADVQKIKDLKEISSFGVLATPVDVGIVMGSRLNI